jgi:tetratricopeptide (TPR) repeat protein
MIPNPIGGPVKAHIPTLLAAIAALMLTAGLAVAQVPASDAAASAAEAADSLTSCIAAAEANRQPEALAGAEAAWSGFEAAHEAVPLDPEPLVGQARVLLQCRLPFAPFMEQGALSARAGEILREALELDPSHWDARYTLGINYFHNPEFMGLTDDAIREFETLLEQQGDRVDFPEMAGPYVYLGDLYARVGRGDEANATWERGAALFPQDPRLAERISARPAGAEGSGAPPDSGAGMDASTDAGVDYEMEPLVVKVEGGYGMDDARQRASLSRLDVYMAPGGTADILQVFQMLPGLTRVSEGSDLYVRGGDPAEAPVMVEGARLLYPGVFETLHGGVFGILDPSVLRRAYFSSGGFSARWGDALSGIVDLETDGAPTLAQARMGLNFVGGGATARSPLGTRGGAWTSIRVTDTALLNALHGETDEYPAAPRSQEGVIGATFAPRPGVELKALALAEGDHAAREIDAIGWRGPFESLGRTALALISARALSSNGAASIRATTSWTRRASDFEFGVLDRERTDQRVALRVDGGLGSQASSQLRFGVEAARLTSLEEGRQPTTERVAPGSPAEDLDGGRDATAHTGGFVEAEVHPVPALAVVAGARVDRLPGEDATTLDPRLAVAWRSGDWTWRVAGGTFQQGRWRVGYDLPDGGDPAGIPRRARHAAFAVEREGHPSLRVETFVKSYDRYVPEEGEIEIEGGRAVGVDALARWAQTDRWGGWVSYSYLHGRLDLAHGDRVPSDVDVTHSLTAVAMYTLGSWQIGGTARYGTGRPYTPVVGSSQGEGFPEPVYGAPMSHRLPDYVRVDSRLTRFQRIAERFTVFYLEVLNVLDRDNASTVIYDANWENPRTLGSIFSARTLVAGVEIQLR